MAPKRKGFLKAKCAAKTIKGMLTKMSRNLIKPIGSTERWSVEDMAKLNEKMEKTSAILRWVVRYTTRVKALKNVRTKKSSSKRKKDQKKKGSKHSERSERKKEKTGRVKAEPLSPIPEDQEGALDFDKIKMELKTTSPLFSPANEDSDDPIFPLMGFGPQNFYSRERWEIIQN